MTNLKKQLDQKNQIQPARQSDLPQKDEMRHFLEVNKAELARAIARAPGLDIDRMSRTFLTVLRLNPKLAECSRPSLFAALIQSAKDGLEPGLDGECYLIPRYSSKLKGFECTYQRGVQGLLKMAHRADEYEILPYARVIHQNDEFDFEEGSKSFIRFKRAWKTERGPVIGYFAHTVLKGGFDAFVIMSKKEVEDFRDKHASTKDQNGKIFGTWVDHFDAMGLKTVLRNLIKYLPKSSDDLRQAIVNDDQVLKMENVLASPKIQELPEDYEIDQDSSNPDLIRAKTILLEKILSIKDQDLQESLKMRIDECQDLISLEAVKKDLPKKEQDINY